MTRSVVQLGGQALKLDADGDTTIQVSSDDVLIISTGGTERLKIDANGHITKPLQPAFLVRKGSDSNNISTGTGVSVVFDTETFDQNGDFNTSSGVFTAPVAPVDATPTFN